VVESAEKAVNASRSVTSAVNGLLRVAAPKSLDNQVLWPLFVEFLKCYSDIQLHLKVSNRILDLFHDGVDFLIDINDYPIEAYVNVNIGRVEQVLCAIPDFLAKHALPKHPDDLKGLTCICLGENLTDNQWRFSNENHKTTVEVTGSYLLNHSECVETRLNRVLVLALYPITPRSKA
jgi:DNA-binding transcriptional LysR family regulator